MEPNVISILGFGAAVIIGGLVMVAVSFFSMKETSYESVVKKKKQAIESVGKEQVKQSKLKRENKRKTEFRKNKGQSEHQKLLNQESDEKLDEKVLPLNSDVIENKQSLKDDSQNKENSKKKSLKNKKETDSSKSFLEKHVASEKIPTKTLDATEITNDSTDKSLPFIEIKKRHDANKSGKKEIVPPVDSKTTSTMLKKKEATVHVTDSESSKDKSITKKIGDQKSDNGNWTKAEGGSRKGQISDLQKQLDLKSSEVVKQNLELLKNQQKIKDLMKDIELKKNYEKSIEVQIGQMKQDHNEKLLLLESKLDEKNKLLIKLQEQQSKSNVTGSMKQLKEENEILRAEIQANARKVSDKNRDIQLLQLKIEDGNKMRNELECKVANYSELLTQKQSESAQLLSQVTMLSEESDNRTALEKEIADTKQELEQRLLELDANEAEKAEEVAKLHTQNKDLSKRVKELELQTKSLNDELIQQKTDSVKVLDEEKRKGSILTEKETLINLLKSENGILNDKYKALEIEIEKLKKKNNELRERNWKAMDAVAATEKSCKDKIAANKEELINEIETLTQKVKFQLSQGFPQANASSSNIVSWLSEFISSVNASFTEKINELSQSNQLLIDETKKDITEYKKNNEFLESRVKELELISENNKKETEKYKKILHSTENILQSLQDGVENEEHQKALFYEKEAQKHNETKLELKLKSELLEQANTERERLQSELAKIKQSSSENLSHVHATGNNQEDQGFLIINQIEQSTSAAQEQNDEISKLKERLDKEKALSKSLGTAASKLQNVLKQTQEELSREREKNKALGPQDED